MEHFPSASTVRRFFELNWREQSNEWRIMPGKTPAQIS